MVPNLFKAKMSKNQSSNSSPNLVREAFTIPTAESIAAKKISNHPPKILLIYGSLRENSYSKKLILEAEILLKEMGCETRIFNPEGLPPFNDDLKAEEIEKVKELRSLFEWSEGQVWCSPEQHGTISGVFKNQIDWVPLSLGGIRPSQHKTVSLFQVNGGSQSFNVLVQMRNLARYMRMRATVNQGTLPKAWQLFDDETGRLKDGPEYRRLVDVLQELVTDTYLTRGLKSPDDMRYSEIVESPEALSTRVNSSE
jgi:arsenic resistance protein ArsH